MIFIICALKCEASPLISTFKLKPVSGFKKQYQAEDITLLVTGVGNFNVQESMSALPVLEDKSHNIFINIGICGCKDRNIHKGSAFIINEIHNDNNDIPKYPDMILNSAFEEAACTSYLNIKIDSACPTLLADMEAYAFYEEALKYSNTSNIHIIKITSDYMDSPNLTKNEISGLINLNRQRIFEYISSIHQAYTPNTPEDYSAFYDSYKFTTSMRIELNRFNNYRLLKHNDEPGSKIYGGFKTPADKKESMRIFHEIKRRLL